MHAKDLISKEKALAKGREKLGQVQILAIFLFLLLIPTTVIIAQNATINDTNMTGNLIELPEQTNTTINITINTTTETNHTNQTNQTFITIPDEWNHSINETDTNETENNQTMPELNETNKTTEPIEPTQPVEPEIVEPESLVIDAGITSPEKVTRNGNVELIAYATNTGSGTARDVLIEWILPDGFYIVTGSGSFHCEELAPGNSCRNVITATVPISSNLGLSEIRARVTYAE